MMKKLILILSILMLGNTLEESTVAFEAYIKQLLEIKVITDEEIISFADNLDKNDLINPINCTIKHCNSDRTLHYEMLESHLEKDLDLESLKIWLQNFLRRRKQDEQKRNEMKEETQSLWKRNMPQRVAGWSENTCAIDKEHKIVCWGPSAKGNIPTSKNIKEISFEDSIFFALEESGDIQSWGNYKGVRKISSQPLKIVQISSGPRVSYVLDETGRALSLDSNNYHDATLPSDQTFFQISVGEEHACALDINMNGHCFGKNDFKQKDIPSNLGSLKQISAATFHSCALLENGKVECWGRGLWGESIPPADLGPVVQIATDRFYSCALQKDGVPKCWSSGLPVELDPLLKALSPIVYMYTSTSQICVVDAKAKIHCFGFDIGYETVNGRKNQKVFLNTEMPVPPKELEIYIDDLLQKFK